jgi:hypothetical protein
VRTTVDFEATFGGHAKIWWADTDGSASRETFDEPTEARLYPTAWAPAEFAVPPAGGMVLRHWLTCGPFGGRGAERFSADPQGAMKDAVRAFYEKAAYPPDTGAFDPAAVFTGDPIAGWWAPEREVRWRAAEIQALDARVWLGTGGAQVWFASAWVRADTQIPVALVVHSMPQARVRLTLDGTTVFDGEATQPHGEAWLTASVPATLAPGWHRVQARTYDWGYGTSRVGVAIDAPRDLLWGVSCSGRPPAGR